METLVAATLTINPTTQSITIDGRLDDPGWQDAAVYDEFYEVSPGENIEPSVKTEAYLVYDDDNFYLGFKCYDPDPDKIRSILGDRDQSSGEDNVGVTIDLFHDSRRAVDFMTNAFGIQNDLSLSDTTDLDPSWDAIWDSAGVITDFGYTVEFAIPFKSLRFANKDIQDWGIVLYRFYPREYGYEIQSYPEDRNRSCMICQFNSLEGLQGVKPGRNIEIIPTLTASRSSERLEVTGPMEDGDTDVEASVSARWGVTPNLTLAGTINPDFSHVEADEIQLEVNERFALYYPEKRPFFMEGTNIFSSPINCTYTRSIVEPDWGLRFTGTEGRNSYGVILAEDESPAFIMPSNQYSQVLTGDDIGIDSVTSTVLRYRRDFGGESSVGFLGTHREGDSYNNTVAGFDGNIKVGGHGFFLFQGLLSETKYPVNDRHPDMDGETKKGHALFLKYWFFNRNWYLATYYKELDPEFRADLGFENRVDTKKLAGQATRTWYGDRGKWYSAMSATLAGYAIQDFDGVTTDQFVEASTLLYLQKQVKLTGSLESEMTRYNGVDYDQFAGNISISLAPNKVVSTRLRIRYGEEVDFSNNRLADYSNYTLSGTLKPNKHLLIDVSATERKLWIDAGDIFKADLYITSLYYYFNRKMFIRSLFQYVDVDYNQALYTTSVPANSREFYTQILFSYKINPFTLAYVGYSDNGIKEDMIPSTTLNRTVFVKLSYAFRP